MLPDSASRSLPASFLASPALTGLRATRYGTTFLVKPARAVPCGSSTTSLYSQPYSTGEEGIKERLSLIAT